MPKKREVISTRAADFPFARRGLENFAIANWKDQAEALERLQGSLDKLKESWNCSPPSPELEVSEFYTNDNVCELASSEYVMEGHTPWENQETIEMVETVVEEEVVSDNATSDSATCEVFDIFESFDNVDLVMCESVPSPDDLVDEDVVEGTVSDSTDPSPTTPEFVEIVDVFEEGGVDDNITPDPVIFENFEKFENVINTIDEDIWRHPDMLPSDPIRLENFYWYCKPKLQPEDNMWGTDKMRSTKQRLGAALGVLHIKPVTLKRCRRKDRAWRFKATSKHSRELIRKQQLGSSRRTGKPFDPGKLEGACGQRRDGGTRGSRQVWGRVKILKNLTARRGIWICATRGRKPTRCAGVDLVTRAPRDVDPRAAGNDQSVFSFIRLDHTFLQFPEGLESSTEYTSRRDALIRRRVLEATVIDRDILGDAGLWGAIEPFLHRTWTHEEASFTCRGWDRIMATDEDVVYTELLLEFISTIQFAPRAVDSRSRMVRFRLGGVQRECNLREFGRRTGIYTEQDLQHRYFARFLGACTRRGPRGRATYVIHFTASCTGLSPPPSCIGRGGEKVFGDDMTFLWVLLDPSRFLHIPFALAIAFATHSTGASSSSPLARGYFITRLARSYGILTAPVVASLTALPPSRTTARTLERMLLIEQQRPGQYIRAPTEPPQAPQPAYAQPGRRRRRPEPAAPEPAQPQPPQEDLAARVARIEDQLKWIGEVLLQIVSAQGQHPPRPFPARAHDHEAGSSRPPGGD
ncbi:hypothetical protein L1887_31563 [Cichorium endivia]|nr:hypothetical protein L1887_31563 [Cichorium endivia]